MQGALTSLKGWEYMSEFSLFPLFICFNEAFLCQTHLCKELGLLSYLLFIMVDEEDSDPTTSSISFLYSGVKIF